MATQRQKGNKNCTGCGHSYREVGPLVELGPKDGSVFLCRGCAGLAVSALDEQERKRLMTDGSKTRIPAPKTFYNHLNKFVIGQDEAKKRISVAVSNHYKRVKDEDGRKVGLVPGGNLGHEDLSEVVIEKSNILMVGPTGCGKTLLAKSLAERLGVPFAIGDATTLTEAGYVGEDVENLLLKLIAAADYDIELAQRGIIYIDEIDKIHKTGHNVSITRDVSGEGVQQSLLKMLEGTVANVPPQGGRKHPEQQYIQIDTTNILFICGGSFVGLEDIIAKRLGQKRIGFGAGGNDQSDTERKNNLLRQVTQDDLIQFGMIPELIGRLPVIAPLNELSVSDLVHVLTKPRDALLKQYKKLFLYDGVELDFTDEAVEAIATLAKEKGTGARALRSVVEEFMNDIMFNLPDTGQSGMSVVITPDVIRKEKPAQFTRKDEAA